MNSNKLKTSLWLGALLLVLNGCAVKLVSDYDETTDRAVSALQRKTAGHLLGLATLANTTGCTYDKHKEFYEEAKTDVSAIEVRTAALANNELETQQVQLLGSSLDSLEQLHQISCLTPDQIKLLMTQLNVQFTSILRFEMARRRGQ